MAGRAVERWMGRLSRRAFEGLVEACRERRRRRMVAGRVVQRLLRRTLRGAWSAWAEAVEATREARNEVEQQKRAREERAAEADVARAEAARAMAELEERLTAEAASRVKSESCGAARRR